MKQPLALGITLQKRKFPTSFCQTTGRSSTGIVSGSCGVSFGTVQTSAKMEFVRSDDPITDLARLLRQVTPPIVLQCPKIDDVAKLRVMTSAMLMGALEGHSGREDAPRAQKQLEGRSFESLVPTSVAIPTQVSPWKLPCDIATEARDYVELRARSCTLFSTSSNLTELGPETMQGGDEIWVIISCHCPLVLQLRESDHGRASSYADRRMCQGI
jgi:hypothetical protein